MKPLNFRERFEESYMPVRIPAENAKGYKTKYIYYAPWYVWDLSYMRLKKEKALILSCSISSFVLFLWIVTRDIRFNYNVLVYAPAVLAFCAHILELVALFRFTWSKVRITKMNYSEVTEVMLYVPAGRGALGLVSGVVSLILVFMDGFSLSAVSVSLGYLIYAGLARFVYRRFSSLPCRIEDNDVICNIVNE